MFNKLLKKILVGQYDPIPSSVPAELRGLCQSLLQISPSQRPSVNRLLEQPFVQTSLRTFSEELEAQTARERAEYEERKRQQPATTAPATGAAPAPAAAATAEPAVSQKDAMAAMRNMGRGQLQAMMKQPNAQLEAEMEHQRKTGAPARQTSSVEEDEGEASIDEEQEQVAQKLAMKSAANAMMGHVGDDDEFGDDGAGAADPKKETIPLANGQVIPAAEVRKYLETEIGAANLGKVMEYVNDLLSEPNAPSNNAIQRELNAMLGPKHAQHSNAITRLAVWEGKVL